MVEKNATRDGSSRRLHQYINTKDTVGVTALNNLWPFKRYVEMKLATFSLIFLLASIAGTPLRAQDGDPRHGRALAQQVCSECHATQTQQLQSPNPRAPTFSLLATTPGMTTTALTVALTTPHAGMPMFRLNSEQRADIIAYIQSLPRSFRPRPNVK
jgi:mono/diheme cytochrome c family protein